MGLGKTVITLTALMCLLFDRFESHRILVIAPLRVARDTWPAEIRKWDPFTRGEWKALIAMTHCEKEELEISDFCWEDEPEDFIATLRKAGLKTFITTDSSTALMENIHAYIAAGCTLEGPVTVEKESWFGTEKKQGLRFSLN